MAKNWAIAIGINQYNNLQHLNYAKLDAEAMRDWFGKEARFDQVFLFTEDSPLIPTNPPIPTQPTFGNLRRFLRVNFEMPLLEPGDCSRLSQHTNKQYRLPSEAEWEYACRAGTTTPFHFGETMITELANYNGGDTYASEPKGKIRGETTEVGSFPPNGFGLYDMHGNLWEWCQDTWHDSYKGAPIDGSAWLNDSSYQEKGISVLRGGSWIDSPDYCRSASRISRNRSERVSIDDDFGFRVACAVGRIIQ